MFDLGMLRREDILLVDGVGLLPGLKLPEGEPQSRISAFVTMTRPMDNELGERFADTAPAESTDLLGMDFETWA